MIWLEMAASFIMGTIGFYMMLRGKKIQDHKMIIWGGVIMVLSYLLFSWGGNDESSKAVLNKLMPTATEPPQP
jgi:predicted tellurium resistance membrane protein TerC